MYRYRLLACVCSIFLLLGGCAWFGDKDGDEAKNWTVERLYSEAKGRSIPAITARRSSIMNFSKPAFHSVFTGNSRCWTWLTPITRLKNLIRPLRPVTGLSVSIPRTLTSDYAYFLKGLVNFNRGKGLTERFLPIDSSQRDQGAALTSFQAFPNCWKNTPRASTPRMQKRGWCSCATASPVMKST